MRWVSYVLTSDSTARFGLLENGTIRSLKPGSTLVSAVQNGTLNAAAEQARRDPFEVVSAADVRLLSPVGTPPSVRDFMSFETHVVTSLAAIGGVMSPVWYEQPVFYFSNPKAIVGPEEDVAVSPGSTEFDFELEIAAVIGQTGSNIPVEEAEDYIVGYALMCDWSARDLQERESRIGLGPAKGKDGTTTLGPVLVTRDELEPRRSERGFDIALTVDVNGRRYSAGNWNSIYWSFAQMVSYASRGTTLVPGDVIGSGTVGTGCILELGRVHGRTAYPYLVPGDTVALHAEILGSLEIAVVPGADPHPL